MSLFPSPPQGATLWVGATIAVSVVLWFESRRLTDRATRAAQKAAATQNFREVNKTDAEKRYEAHRPIADPESMYAPAEASSARDPVDPALMRSVVATNKSLFAGLRETNPMVPALICEGGMIRRGGCSEVPLGLSRAHEIGWVPSKFFTVEVRPGFELVASDGEHDQIWVGPITAVSKHEQFAPTTFVARESSPASEWRRSRLPVKRVRDLDRELAQAGGEMSEVQEQQLDFVNDRNADLAVIHASWAAER